MTSNIRKINKIIVILFFLIAISFVSFSQDNNDNSSDKSVKIKTGDLSQDDFNNFIVNYIGDDITVYVANLDVTINGKLISVYSNGILLQPLFKQKVFIFTSSIAFLEIKGFSRKQK